MSLEKVIFGWMFILGIFIAAFVLFFPKQSRNIIRSASTILSPHITTKKKQKALVKSEKKKSNLFVKTITLTKIESQQVYVSMQKQSDVRMQQLCILLKLCPKSAK